MAMTPFLRALLEAPGDEKEQNNPTDDVNQEQGVESSAAEESPDTLEDPFDDEDRSDSNVSNGKEEEGESGEELSDPPDGLPSPDETDDTTTDDSESDEQNIQLNILSLSKLDRLTLKQKCFNNFKDLRLKINRAIALVEDNEQLMSGDFREGVHSELGSLYSAVTNYMMTRFSYNNYEENAKNFNILAFQFNDLLKKLKDSSNYEDK